MKLNGPSAILTLACCCCFAGEVAAGPSYDCGKIETGGIEELICKDQGLAALDGKLAEVYGAATRLAGNEQLSVLKAEQRGWIKGRDDCWKSVDQRQCVEEEYRRRIAELQATYRLVAAKGPVTFTCDDDPRNQVIVTYFETDPPTLIAARGDSVSLMYLQTCESGNKYVGRNEGFWEHHNAEALITWGFGTKEMRCRRSP